MSRTNAFPRRRDVEDGVLRAAEPERGHCLRCGEPVLKEGDTYCEGCDNGPREATSQSALVPRHPSLGGCLFTFSKRDLIESVVHPLTETAWIAAERNDRAFADLLLEIVEEIVECSERARQRAIRNARDRR